MDWLAAQDRMIAQQIAARGIQDPRVIAAMRDVPRHLYVPEALQADAYADRALPIGEYQTISQPYMVATMLRSLALTGSERVLEIGTGSGYNAALLARLAREVHTVEIDAALALAAEQRLARLGVERVQVHTGDGTLGWPEAAPYDAVVVTAGAPEAPPPLMEQVADAGRLLIPITRIPKQEMLTLFWRRGPRWEARELGPCSFVPLFGEYGVQR